MISKDLIIKIKLTDNGYCHKDCPLRSWGKKFCKWINGETIHVGEDGQWRHDECVNAVGCPPESEEK